VTVVTGLQNCPYKNPLPHQAAILVKLMPVCATGPDGEVEEGVAAPQAKAKKGKKKAVSNFAALAMEEEDDPELQVHCAPCGSS